MIEFRLPSLGAEMEDGTLLEWRVKPGDRVKKGDVVAVVDTSKSAIDVEIWQEGTVNELVLTPGDKVPVGTVMIRLRETGGAGAPAAKSAAASAVTPTAAPETAAAPAPAAATSAVATPAVSTAAAARTAPPTAVPRPAAPRTAEGRNAAAATPVASAGERQRASPSARALAHELDIDLATVAGTGPHGVITREDVEKVAASRKATKAAPGSVATTKPQGRVPAETAGVAPVRAATPVERSLAMRSAIAAAMARSKREIPHYYLATEVPMQRITRWLAARNAGRPVTERVLMAAPLIKAVALALRKFPELNGFYQNGGFVSGQGIHIGVAISLRQGGLIAPAIRDVADTSLDELMRRLANLVSRARALSLRSSEMTDATITVTNLGDQGVELVQGVIYPPQVALVGFGKVTDRVRAVEDGAIAVMPAVTLSLAADHRASDGHRGALFLAEIARLLQSPEGLDVTTDKVAK